MAQSSYDSFLVDLDGTANIGDLPVPYAVDALNTFGDCVVYVTNNASRSPDTVHHRLKRIGYNTDVQHIVTSAQLAAQVMKKDLVSGAEVLVLGTPYLEQVVRESGFSTVRDNSCQTKAVVQGHSDATGWKQLSAAARAIRNGARYYATNKDTCLPSEQGLNVGNGAMVAAVEVSTGVRAITAGKPAAQSMQQAAHLVEGQNPLVIGDRLDTDIEGGNNAGYDTLCVLTGVTSITDICNASKKQRPTYVVPDLRFLKDLVCSPKDFNLPHYSRAYAKEILLLDVDCSGVSTVRFLNKHASHVEKIAALIVQAWDNTQCVKVVKGFDTTDTEELVSWSTL